MGAEIVSESLVVIRCSYCGLEHKFAVCIWIIEGKQVRLTIEPEGESCDITYIEPKVVQ